MSTPKTQSRCIGTTRTRARHVALNTARSQLDRVSPRLRPPLPRLIRRSPPNHSYGTASHTTGRTTLVLALGRKRIATRRTSSRRRNTELRPCVHQIATPFGTEPQTPTGRNKLASAELAGPRRKLAAQLAPVLTSGRAVQLQRITNEDFAAVGAQLLYPLRPLGLRRATHRRAIDLRSTNPTPLEHRTALWTRPKPRSPLPWHGHILTQLCDRNHCESNLSGPIEIVMTET
jgi:hypothetical protein